MQSLTRQRKTLWLAAGAAAMLLAAAGIHAQNQMPGMPGFSYGDLKNVTLQGKLVSLGEELARKYGARVPAGTPKQLGLALPEGQFYSFLDTAELRKLAAAGLENKAVEVQARHFPRSMLLEVISFKPLPAESIRRTFYCGVCDITTEDFGPCVCCGKEVELVKDEKKP